MDKNIVAFLREEVHSIYVRFFQDRPGENVSLGNKAYMYLTMDQTIAIGDYVIVDVNGIPKVTIVDKVSKDLDITPDADKEYKYIVGKLDLTEYKTLLEENRKLEEVLRKGYRNNLRANFKAVIMANLDDTLKGEVQSLLK